MKDHVGEVIPGSKTEINSPECPGMHQVIENLALNWILTVIHSDYRKLKVQQGSVILETKIATMSQFLCRAKAWNDMPICNVTKNALVVINQINPGCSGYLF